MRIYVIKYILPLALTQTRGSCYDLDSPMLSASRGRLYAALQRDMFPVETRYMADDWAMRYCHARRHIASKIYRTPEGGISYIRQDVYR